MYFKTTILRSNPQVIREFEMADENTIKELFHVVEILHDWKRGTELELLHNAEKVSEEHVIASLFTEGTFEDEWIIQGYFKENPFFTQTEVWRIRVDAFVGKESDEEKTLPRLIRYKGLNPDTSWGSLSRWNERAMRLDFEETMYEYGKGYLHKAEYELKEEQVQARLERVGSADGMSIRIDWNLGQDLYDIIESMSVDDMKRVIQNHRLPVKYNQRKVQIIDELVRYYDKADFWHRVLNEMTYQEYEEFKSWVQGQGTLVNRRNSVLYGYGLVKAGYTLDQMVPVQLLHYYENWMENQGDARMIEEKKADEILECGCRLYGFFTKEMACRLGDVMYPEVELSKKLGLYWKSKGFHYILDVDLWNSAGRPRKSRGMEIMIDAGNLGGSEAVRGFTALSQTVIEPYIPDQAEAIEIARNGLHFDRNAEKEFMEELKKLTRYRVYWNGGVERLYELCHLNYKMDEIISTLRREFYSLVSDKNAYKHLAELIRKHKDSVRQIMFAGHTGAEALELYHLRLEEK